MKIDALNELENIDFWITDQAVSLTNGSVSYTQYWRIPGGGSILRDAIDPGHEQSVPWLMR